MGLLLPGNRSVRLCSAVISIWAAIAVRLGIGAGLHSLALTASAATHLQTKNLVFLRRPFSRYRSRLDQRFARHRPTACGPCQLCLKFVLAVIYLSQLDRLLENVSLTHSIHRYGTSRAKAFGAAFMFLLFVCAIWPMLFLVCASALMGAVATGYLFKHHIVLPKADERRQPLTKREPLTIEGEYRILSTEN
jgi:hypothetical protein